MVVVFQNQQFVNHQKTQVQRPAQNTPLFNGEKTHCLKTERGELKTAQPAPRNRIDPIITT